MLPWSVQPHNGQKELSGIGAGCELDSVVGKELVCGGIKKGRGLEDTATGSEYRERKSLNTESGSLSSCWKLEKARTLELLEGGNLADTGSRPVTPFGTLSSRVWCSAELGSASKLWQKQETFGIQAEVTTGERQWLCWARHLGGSGK